MLLNVFGVVVNASLVDAFEVAKTYKYGNELYWCVRVHFAKGYVDCGPAGSYEAARKFVDDLIPTLKESFPRGPYR